MKIVDLIMSKRNFIARNRLRFALGTAIVGTFLFCVNLLTFAKVWQSTFEAYGIPPVIIFVVLPISYVITCWYVGYMYDTRGFWSQETSHTNKNLNPEFYDMMDDVKLIKQNMENINKYIEQKKQE